MKQIKIAENLTLEIEGNNFGDQILAVRKDNEDGTHSFPWVQTNPEGEHETISTGFINNILNKLTKIG